MSKRIRNKIEKEVDAEYLAKSKEQLKTEFDESQALHVPAQKTESKLISIRLPLSMIHELKKIVHQRGDMGYQQLIKIFIAEGLSKAQYNDTAKLNRLSESKSRIAKATIPYSLLQELLKVLEELRQVRLR